MIFFQNALKITIIMIIIKMIMITVILALKGAIWYCLFFFLFFFFFFFFRISSLRRELSPKRTLKWPGPNRVQITRKHIGHL